MAREAEMPGRLISMEQWQMICLRYYTIGKFMQKKEVLEVACGPGLGLGYLSKRAKKVVGGDISKENIKCARQHYGNKVELLLMDAHKLPFKNESFDLVATMEVIYYLQFGKFLEECYRVLKKGGMFIFCLPNKYRRDGFQESPLSHKYYSIPELFALLNQHRFDTRLFGAFPVRTESGGVARQELLGTLAKEVKQVIEVMPNEKSIKGLINRFILHKVVLKEEIFDKDMKILEDIQLVPLSRNSPNFEYKILYGLARVWKSKKRPVRLANQCRGLI